METEKMALPIKVWGEQPAWLYEPVSMPPYGTVCELFPFKAHCLPCPYKRRLNPSPYGPYGTQKG